jgi:hypothetical protein
MQQCHASIELRYGGGRTTLLEMNRAELLDGARCVPVMLSCNEKRRRQQKANDDSH